MTTDAISDKSLVVDSGQTATQISVEAKVCQNCGDQLSGPFCGRCGQSERSVIEFFGYVIMHIMDDIFGFDSRAGRTLFPLIFRPGFLTNEYFRGRRVRYVPPIRLYIFVSIIFFILLGLFTDDSVKDLVKLQQNNTFAFNRITDKVDILKEKMAASDYVLQQDDQEELEQLLEDQQDAENDLHESIIELQNEVDEIETREKLPGYVADPAEQIKKSAFKGSIEMMRSNLTKAHKSSMQNQAKLQQAESVETELEDADKEEVDSAHSIKTKIADKNVGVTVDFGDGISWLSKEQNKNLETLAEDLTNKAKEAIEKDAAPLIRQILGVLPQMMFVLLPIFALILKIVYLFSKRYYMEHLTVALHSHAFLFVVLMLTALFSSLNDALPDSYNFVANLLEYATAALLIWAPIYLFIMQKKVYKQGYFITTIKFCFVGLSYFILIAMTSVIAFIWGLATL